MGTRTVNVQPPASRHASAKEKTKEAEKGLFVAAVLDAEKKLKEAEEKTKGQFQLTLLK
jgi:hypothetical protein